MLLELSRISTLLKDLAEKNASHEEVTSSIHHVEAMIAKATSTIKVS